MPSSPESRILGADDAHRVAPARLDARLRTTPFLDDLRHDSRVLDPRLSAVVEDAARRAAEQGHQAGWEAGHAQGLSDGLAEAAERMQAQADADERALTSALDRLSSAASALVRAASSLETRALPVYEEVGSTLGPLVVDLVEALLGRELQCDRVHVLDAVRRAAAAAVQGAPLTLRVSPDDALALGQPGIDLEAQLGRPVTVVADASVEPGGALADSGARHVDARLTTALARLRAELAS